MCKKYMLCNVWTLQCKCEESRECSLWTLHGVLRGGGRATHQARVGEGGGGGGIVMLGQYCSVYEKLFKTSDIMSDAFELCVGHFHFMLDIFLFNIKTLDSVIKNSHIYAKIRDILTPTQTFGLLDNLTMCQTFCPTF